MENYLFPITIQQYQIRGRPRHQSHRDWRFYERNDRWSKTSKAFSEQMRIKARQDARDATTPRNHETTERDHVVMGWICVRAARLQHEVGEEAGARSERIRIRTGDRA